MVGCCCLVVVCYLWFVGDCCFVDGCVSVLDFVLVITWCFGGICGLVWFVVIDLGLG